MNGFKLGQRVRIVAGSYRSEINGMTGTVIKLFRIRSGKASRAWIQTDAELPKRFRYFSSDDPRRNHMKVYDYEVEPA